MNKKMTDENMEKKANSNLENNEEAVDLNQDTTQEESNEPQEQLQPDRRGNPNGGRKPCSTTRRAERQVSACRGRV